jgi:hypothetical protein
MELRNMDIYDTLLCLKNHLKNLLNNGTVKDPALFWAGQMSNYVTELKSQHNMIVQIEMMNILFLVQEEYDRVIFNRT